MREFASKFNLNILHSSWLVGSSFNKIKGVWNARIHTPFGIKTIRARQLVQATGVGCDHPYIPKLRGKEEYQGLANFHSKYYKNPKQLLDKGAKVRISSSVGTIFMRLTAYSLSSLWAPRTRLLT